MTHTNQPPSDTDNSPPQRHPHSAKERPPTVAHQHQNTDRGVSFILQYIFGLSLLLGILGILTFTIGDEVSSTQEKVAEQELERIGTEVAASLQRADAQISAAEATASDAQTNSDTTVRVSMDLPATVTGTRYVIRANGGTLIIASTDPSIGVGARVPLSLSTSVTANGGTAGTRALIVYDPTEDELRIESERTN